MKLNITRMMAIVGAVLIMAVTARDAPVETPAHVRKFHFTYNVTVKGLSPEDHQVRIWIPVAQSDSNQQVTLKNISSLVPTHMSRDPEYHNQILYADIRNPKEATATITLEYLVARKEYSKGSYEDLMRYNGETQKIPEEVNRFLQPDRLVPIDGKMRELAEANTQGKQGTVEKAHALYDYVFKTLRYDKSGTGWGRGDSLWACDAKHGNCTDFHSLFISMMRAENIPARFEIGFPLPANSNQGDIAGYHCWAEYYVTGTGWVPVDISEAWKDPAKHDFFFGSLDSNRVQFTIGRDLELAPRQDGPPLNYFVYPYVEVDGKPYDALEKKFAFREDTDPGSTVGGK
ncbi:MAG TPA: transglutaminase domain-containing protein [Terriglobia bacterium]|nr:transglutaminase domain-containing protein [Terriglobia bacterium]